MFIKFTASLYRAVSQVKSTEKTRYYLNGVYVQPHVDGGVLLVATDAHRMMVAHDASGTCKVAKIVALPKEAMTTPIVRNNEFVEVDADGVATIGVFRSTKTTFIDGTFPDWSRVLTPILNGAKKPSYALAAFNGNYVASFGKIAELLGTDKSSSIQVVSFSDHNPALILFPRSPEAFGILMPMRATLNNAMPAFMRPVMEPMIAPKKKTARRASQSLAA